LRIGHHGDTHLESLRNMENRPEPRLCLRVEGFLADEVVDRMEFAAEKPEEECLCRMLGKKCSVPGSWSCNGEAGASDRGERRTGGWSMSGWSREVREVGEVKLVDWVSREWMDMELRCSLWRELMDMDDGMRCVPG